MARPATPRGLNCAGFLARYQGDYAAATALIGNPWRSGVASASARGLPTHSGLPSFVFRPGKPAPMLGSPDLPHRLLVPYTLHMNITATHIHPILEAIQAAGGRPLIVGGAVRDAL